MGLRVERSAGIGKVMCDSTVFSNYDRCGEIPVQSVCWWASRTFLGAWLLPFGFQFFSSLAAVFSIAEKGLGTQVGTQSSCLIIFRLWLRVVPPGLARTTHPL